MTRNYVAMPTGEALIPETELERMKRTEKRYMLTEAERLDIIARYGPPVRPHKAFEGQGVFKIPNRRERA